MPIQRKEKEHYWIKIAEKLILKSHWIRLNSFRIKHDILRYFCGKKKILSQQACHKIDQDLKFTSNKNSHFFVSKKIAAYRKLSSLA